MACTLALGLPACYGNPTADENDTDAGSDGSGDTGGPMSPTSMSGDTGSDDPSDPGTSGGADGTDDSGDSEGSDGDDATAASSSTGEPMADTGDETTTGALAPEVLESSPADGEAGVTEDAAIVVRFNQPMDKAATQLAYQSVDIPAAAATFTWNATGDEMTVTPNDVLPYALGDDPSTLEAETFTFTITTAAESEDGVPLDSDYTATFTTLRVLLQYVAHDADLSGKTTDLGDKTPSGYLGDYPDNDTARYFVTFDLSGLAPEIVHVEAATFSLARNGDATGSPFTELGALLYQKVAFDEFSQALHETPGIGMGAGILVSPDAMTAEVDIVDDINDVLADPATFDGRVQYRLVWFPSETDGDSSYDGITINPNAFELGVLYLAP